MSVREKTFYVYLVANKRRTVLYTGATNSLARRIWQHRHGRGSVFAAKYRATELIYVETYPTATSAIAREKQIKGWGRAKKLELVLSVNPEMVDLSDSVLW